MTQDTDGWAGSGTVMPGPQVPAAPHLQHADEWVGEALRAVVAADGVAWSSAASTRYREVLADGAETLRSVRNKLHDAIALAAKHDAAIELARQTTPLSSDAFRALVSVPGSGARPIAGW